MDIYNYFREECWLRVFENRILRRILGPKRDENEEWRRLHNEKLHSLYSSPNIVRAIKSKRLRWGGHVARGMIVGSGKEGFIVRNFIVCTVHLEWA